MGGVNVGGSFDLSGGGSGRQSRASPSCSVLGGGDAPQHVIVPVWSDIVCGAGIVAASTP